MTRRRLVVTGRVQNVFYRDWFVEQAMALGLDGWVRNRAAARVEDVAVSDDAPAGTLAGFAKRATL